jgi:hypothetical protein
LEFRLPAYRPGAPGAAVLARWPVLFACLMTFSCIGILWLYAFLNRNRSLLPGILFHGFACRKVSHSDAPAAAPGQC